MCKIKHLAFWTKFSLKSVELQSQLLPVIRERGVTVVSVVGEVFQISTFYCPVPVMVFLLLTWDLFIYLFHMYGVFPAYMSVHYMCV